MTDADRRALMGLQENLRLRVRVAFEAGNLEDYDRHIERLLRLSKLLGRSPLCGDHTIKFGRCLP